jgi:hypothetical protein
MSKAKRAAYTRVKGTKVQMKHVGAVKFTTWSLENDRFMVRTRRRNTHCERKANLPLKPAFLGIRHFAYRQFSSLLFVLFLATI